jgi:hypothetical protein
MSPCLIIDFRRHSLFALLVTAAGEVVPCTQELGGVVTRSFSADFLFAPGVTERGDFDWETLAEVFPSGTQRPSAKLARRLGVLRPWDRLPDGQTVVLQPPLEVLSSAALAGSDPAQRRDLFAAAAALAGEQLSPVFESLARRGLSPRDVAAVAIVPASTGRRAALLLHMLFRREGCRRLALLRRETAAALALLDEGSPTGNLIVDLEDEALHLHRVTLMSRPDAVSVRCLGSRSLRGVGRRQLVQRLGTALAGAGRLPPGTHAASAALDRAFLGLCGGPYPAEVPGEPPLRLTQGLFAELLAQGAGADLAADLERQLRPCVAALFGGEAASATPLVALGSAFAVSEIEVLVARAAGGEAPASVARTPVRERCARGVAALLLRLAGGRPPKLEISDSAGVRIDDLRGGSIELLPAATLPQAPSGAGTFRQRLRVESAPEAAEVGGQLLVNLLWGCNPDPGYAAPLGSLVLETGDMKRSLQPHLSLELRLKRNRQGWLSGRATAAYGSARASARLGCPGGAGLAEVIAGRPGRACAPREPAVDVSIHMEERP